MAEEVKPEPTFEYCESCGIQMKTAEDHGGGDLKNIWCKECCHPSGELRPREEVRLHIMEMILDESSMLVMGEKVTDIKEAEKLADEYMQAMPTWKTVEIRSA